MADVTVTINGHNYVVACKDGEEKHLHFLADYVAKKVASLVVSFGQIGESRLLLMSALFIADELSEAFAQLGDLKAEVAELKIRLQKAERAMNAAGKNGGDGADKNAMDEEAVAAVLNDAARRIEELALRVDQS
ncbi:MAG TPA: cell division protein ZapA [Alphaproteobacteria bacterium]|nr:cell division protein ZapA [Alphaproteobacteria bacterium]